MATVQRGCTTARQFNLKKELHTDLRVMLKKQQALANGFDAVFEQAGSHFFTEAAHSKCIFAGGCVFNVFLYQQPLCLALSNSLLMTYMTYYIMG